MLWEKNKDLALAGATRASPTAWRPGFTAPVDLKLFGQPVTFAPPGRLEIPAVRGEADQGLPALALPVLRPHKGPRPVHGADRGSAAEPSACPHPVDPGPEPREPIDRSGAQVAGVSGAEAANGRQDQRGNLQPLEIIQENTEYPFWSPGKESLVAPAQGITLLNQGVRAFKALRNYLTALSKSDPPDYCRQIGEFLDSHPMSTEITEWPQRSE